MMGLGLRFDQQFCGSPALLLCTWQLMVSGVSPPRITASVHAFCAGGIVIANEGSNHSVPICGGSSLPVFWHSAQFNHCQSRYEPQLRFSHRRSSIASAPFGTLSRASRLRHSSPRSAHDKAGRTRFAAAARRGFGGLRTAVPRSCFQGF